MKKQPSGFDAGGVPRFENSKQLGINLAENMSLSVRVFMRRNTGYQRLRLLKIYGVAGVLMLFNIIGNLRFAVPFVGVIGAGSRSDALRYYAIAFLAWAIIQRKERYKEFRAGVVRHGFDGGTSWLEFLAPYLRREWIYKFIEPAGSFLIGYLLRRAGFFGLGLWVMGASAALAIVETATWERAEEKLWTVRNGGLDAEVLADMASGPSDDAPTHINPPGSPASGQAGVSSGVDDALAQDIAQRRRAAGMEADDVKDTAVDVKPSLPSLTSALDFFKRMDDGTKVTFAVFAVVLVVLVYFGHGSRHSARERSEATQERAEVRPQQFAPAATPPVSAPVAVSDAGRDFLGAWQGHALVKEGSCFLSMEVRRKSEAAFSGFPALICLPMDKPAPAAALLARVNPATAILSGELKNGSIDFNVDKVTGASEIGCAMSGFTLTPFGLDKLAAEWKDSCGGGQMLLVRGR